MTFNSGLYNSMKKALLKEGLPEDLVEKASRIVASDDPDKPSFGRSEEDQKIVHELLMLYNQAQKAKQ